MLGVFKFSFKHKGIIIKIREQILSVIDNLVVKQPSDHAWLDCLSGVVYSITNHDDFEERTGLKFDTMAKNGFARLFVTTYNKQDMGKMVVEFDEIFKDKCRSSLYNLFKNNNKFVAGVNKIIFTSPETFTTVTVDNFMKFGFAVRSELSKFRESLIAIKKLLEIGKQVLL